MAKRLAQRGLVVFKPRGRRSASRQKNAHLTNTAEEMQDALQGDYQWVEGDVRRSPPVMAHDWHHNDGLTLDQWLEIGDASGRNLKLDIKEHQSVDGIIEAVQASGIDPSRLMFNADTLRGPGGRSPNVTQEDLQKLREAFPEARIGAQYTEAQLEEMIAQAEVVGGPIVFPLREDLVRPDTVSQLQAYGDVTIWNDPKRVALTDVEARTNELLAWGVRGFIDLRAS